VFEGFAPDGVPIGEALARCRPKAGAERVISADPDASYGTERQRERMQAVADAMTGFLCG
jgi:hypothetical protein